jgi:hypothetical protein
VTENLEKPTLGLPSNFFFLTYRSQHSNEIKNMIQKIQIEKESNQQYIHYESDINSFFFKDFSLEH